MTEDRAPIWTIPSGEATAFFAYFTTLNILGLCFVGWHEHLTNQTQGILNIIREVIADAGSVTVGSAGIAITASEFTRWIMVLANFFREKFLIPQREKYREQGREQGQEQGREQGQEQGRDQGRKEMAARWREWNQRRLDAQARDEDFNEPPPVDE